MAPGSDPVRHGVPCGGCSVPQSPWLKQDAVYMATGGVVDLRRRVCDSHCARTLSSSQHAPQNGTSRRLVCSPWSIWSCRRREHPRPTDRNWQPAPARPGACTLADHNRRAGVCGGVDCGGCSCSNATEFQNCSFGLSISTWKGEVKSGVCLGGTNDSS